MLTAGASSNLLNVTNTVGLPEFTREATTALMDATSATAGSSSTMAEPSDMQTESAITMDTTIFVAPSTQVEVFSTSGAVMPTSVESVSTTLEPSSTPTEPSIALGSVRLVNGTGPHEGRVEIFYNDTWGTVCDNHWSLKDGLVVCRQLGYPGVLSVYKRAHFGEGTGPILFDNLICKGNESDLTQCPNGEVNCDHSEDAGVTCRETVEPSSTPTEPSTAPGSVRLVDGTGSHEGRVEIFYNNTWGTVCDNHWSLNDGLVVCRQLGYPGVLSVYKRAHFGEGTGPILFDNLICKGTEGNLTQCPNGEVNCDHSEDAGVTCARETVEPSSTPTEPSIAPGSVRLVDGTGPHEGRVEIFYNDTWGTVCDNHWSLNDGLVVCRQLGYPGVLSVYKRAHFGEGTGPILFDNLICKGTEGNLTQCPNGEVNCDHSEDAGVTCARETVEPSSTPTEPSIALGSVRLVDGTGPHEGRVEIFYNDTWGTVCDNHWSLNDGLVVCRQLGYPGVLSVYKRAHFGEGTGPILFDNLICKGNESDLTQCPNGEVNCDHSEDAGVTCRETVEPSSTPTEPSIAPGSVRLVDGTGSHEGRVEIFYNNTWGTVCDNHWSLNDGLVVCRQLGYPGVLSVYKRAHFGEGTGPILFDNLLCKGTEGNLTQCPNGEVNCDHSEDAGVTCARETVEPSSTPTEPSIAPGSVRLVDGTGPHEGRVEIFYNDTWGTVCDNHWSLNDGLVVCRQLGYPGVLSVYKRAHFGEGTGPILFDNLICKGTEGNLTQCPNGEVNCDHSEDAGVTCRETVEPSSTPTEPSIALGSVRLVDGTGSHEGRVEIFYNDTWGTVCDNHWSLNDGLVVCRQLGYPGVLSVYKRAHFGEGTGPILFDNLICKGNESDLTQCPNGEVNCDHSEDAGVTCRETVEPSSTPTEPSIAPGSVRLVDGTGSHEGRVEIFYNNTWGTVCDNHWSLNDGLVVCRQLGYPGVLSVYKRAHFGEGTGPILFDNLLCKGTEGNLTQCPNGDVNCDHSEDAGVTCARETVEPSSTPTEPSIAPGSVRLVDGTGPHEGRVEIFYNDTWGTVCDNHWSLNDGLVVCRQLGYPGVLSVYKRAHFGEGTGLILFDNLICKGTEDNLTQCPNGDVNCDHSEDAGVTCARETLSPTSTTKGSATANSYKLPSTTSVLMLPHPTAGEGAYKGGGWGGNGHWYMLVGILIWWV